MSQSDPPIPPIARATKGNADHIWLPWPYTAIFSNSACERLGRVTHELQFAIVGLKDAFVHCDTHLWAGCIMM